MSARRPTPRSARLVGWMLPLGLAVAGPRVSAAAACPENWFAVAGAHIASFTRMPTGSMIWTEGVGHEIVPWKATEECPEGCYDLPNGTLVARGYNYLYGPSDTVVRVSDKYVVLGPAGSTVPFEVLLRLETTIEDEGTSSAGLDVADAPSTTLQRTAPGTEIAALPITATVGTPFTVSAWVHAVGGHHGGMALSKASILFRGLPHGYVISSCQGYDVPTPTRGSTWGAVKAHYRSR